jgi:hypothetical protein
MDSRPFIVHGAVKHIYFYYKNNSGFAEFRYVFLPIRPLSGEVVTKTYEEGRTNIVKDLSRTQRCRGNKTYSK